MSEFDEEKILTEIMGTFTPPPPTNNNPYNPINTPPQNNNILRRGFTVSHCSNLEGWQRAIVSQLSGQTGQDAYVIARPGGGKTLPIICYWTDQILKLNTLQSPNINVNFSNIKALFVNGPERQSLKKLLYTVPVIVLAQQTAMEIRKYLASIMTDYYNNNTQLCIRNFMYRGNIKTYLDQIQNIERILQNNPHLQNSLNSLKQALKNEVENFITNTVDQLVYVKTGSFTSGGDGKNALVFVTIFESATSVIDKIENLGLTIIDEAHLIQKSGIQDDDNSRAYQIMGKLFDVLKKIKKFKNNRLVMLSGTINPESAKKVTKYFNDCFERNFKEPTAAPISASNRSQLAIITNERITTNNEIVSSITRSIAQRDWGQLYVLFSTNRIKEIIELCIDKLGTKNVENYSPGGYEPSSSFDGLGERRQNSIDYKLNKSSVDRLSIPPGKQFLVSNITNPLLRQAVLRGVGFITRNIPENPLENKPTLQMNDDDKIIVSKLFRERKISVLLATDAVGIGVNIDVKDLYIPAVEKFNSNVQNMVTASLRDLSQILNRAGRGATPIASIQTPSKNLEIVTNALYANPEDLPNVDELRRRGINPCDYKSFYNLLRKL